MKHSFKLKISFVVLLLFIVSIEASLYFEEVANLTPAQRKTLSRFRSQVEDLLPHDYMKEDLYLIRFLKSKNFRLQDSILAIKEAMQWRELNSMDSIDNEDFSDMEQDFPLYFDGVDKQGRIVMESHFGEWPVRTAVVGGKLQRLNRYGVKAIEDATRKVRDLQASGKNVTQWVMLLNMDGFNVIQNACPSCKFFNWKVIKFMNTNSNGKFKCIIFITGLPYYLNFVSSYEKYYPFSVGHMVYVNSKFALRRKKNP